MANYSVDHLEGKVIITNSKKLTAEENVAIAELRKAGYTVEMKKRKAPAKRVLGRDEYKELLTAEQFKELEKKAENEPWVSVGHWANSLLKK